MWLKIKVWTKVTVASLLGLYALLFVYNNSGQQIPFWWWFGKSTGASVFTLSAVAFVSGGLIALLLATTWKTIRQIRELKRRSREQRTERELADMKAKAAMLQKRGIAGAEPGESRPAVAPAGGGTVEGHRTA